MEVPRLPVVIEMPTAPSGWRRRSKPTRGSTRFRKFPFKGRKMKGKGTRDLPLTPSINVALAPRTLKAMSDYYQNIKVRDTVDSKNGINSL